MAYKMDEIVNLLVGEPATGKTVSLPLYQKVREQLK